MRLNRKVDADFRGFGLQKSPDKKGVNENRKAHKWYTFAGDPR
jgi:hypothetical protein